MMTFGRAMGFIAQGAINVDCGITTLEKGSPTHTAMNELCRLVNDGHVGLTAKGEQAEREEGRGDVEFWFEEWNQGVAAPNFATRLFDLISSADSENLEFLRRGFPLFVTVFEEKMERVAK